MTGVKGLRKLVSKFLWNSGMGFLSHSKPAGPCGFGNEAHQWARLSH